MLAAISEFDGRPSPPLAIFQLQHSDLNHEQTFPPGELWREFSFRRRAKGPLAKTQYNQTQIDDAIQAFLEGCNPDDGIAILIDSTMRLTTKKHRNPLCNAASPPAPQKPCQILSTVIS